jgi:hypothetical protein
MIPRGNNCACHAINSAICTDLRHNCSVYALFWCFIIALCSVNIFSIRPAVFRKCFRIATKKYQACNPPGGVQAAAHAACK